MAKANSTVSENAIEEITADRGPHYEPFGWHHWPEYPWMSYQFRRALGETQEGGGASPKCFLAAKPHDSRRQGELAPRMDADRRPQPAARLDEEAKGHVRTAMNCWLRAANYYRQAEFWP